MTDYDSADLLAQWKRTVGLGSNVSGITDAQIYTLLSNAQRRLIALLATHVPDSQVAAPEQLTTADGGLTYTFASYPFGHIELRDGRDGEVIYPANDWDWQTEGLVIEGQTLRVPNGETRTFDNGLWARYVPVPAAISAAVQPVLKPEYARMAIVYEAAREWATQGGTSDPTPYKDALQRELWGDPQVPGHHGVILALKEQYFGHGMRASVPSVSRWWKSPDLS